MIVEWYKREFYVVVQQCCGFHDELYPFINWQPDGLFLELPIAIHYDIIADASEEEQDPVTFKRYLKINFCPRCGDSIIMKHMSENDADNS